MAAFRLIEENVGATDPGTPRTHAGKGLPAHGVMPELRVKPRIVKHNDAARTRERLGALEDRQPSTALSADQLSLHLPRATAVHDDNVDM